MIRVVRRAVALCFLCCPSATAPAAAPGLVSRLEWPGGLTVRCEIPVGAGSLLLHGGAGPGDPPWFAAGLEAPFARVGRLAPTGLLRLARAPLGFEPGSGVMDEATDLRLDRSTSGPGELSVALLPLPEHLVLFWLRPHGEPAALGCVAGAGRGETFSLDGAVAMRDIDSEAAGEAWIAPCAPLPAGRVLNAAVRMAFRLPRMTAVASGGLSAAERAPPGWFVLCTAAFGRHDSGVDVLAAAASRDYIEFGEDRPSAGARAGVRLRYASPEARFQARYVMSVGLPGFAAGPFLPSEEDLAFVFTRRWPADGGGAWEAELRLANRIEIDGDGATVDDPSGSLSAGWTSARCQARLSVEAARGDEAAIGVAASALLDAGGGWRLGAEAGCSLGTDDPASLSVSAHARWDGAGGELLLRAGVRNLRTGCGWPDGAAPWASLEWRVTDRPEGG